jgi:hypothetical protein
MKGWAQSPIGFFDHKVEHPRFAGAGKATLNELVGQSGQTGRGRCLHRSEDTAAWATSWSVTIGPWTGDRGDSFTLLSCKTSAIFRTRRRCCRSSASGWR